MAEFETKVLGIPATVEYEVVGLPYSPTHTDPGMGVDIELIGVFVNGEPMEIDWLYRRSRVKRNDTYEDIYDSIEDSIFEECVEHWENNRD